LNSLTPAPQRDPALNEFLAVLHLCTQIDRFLFSQWIFDNWDALNEEFAASSEPLDERRAWMRQRYIECNGQRLPRVSGARLPQGTSTSRPGLGGRLAGLFRRDRHA
jgi:hypothetical protein